MQLFFQRLENMELKFNFLGNTKDQKRNTFLENSEKKPRIIDINSKFKAPKVVTISKINQYEILSSILYKALPLWRNFISRIHFYTNVINKDH